MGMDDVLHDTVLEMDNYFNDDCYDDIWDIQTRSDLMKLRNDIDEMRMRLDMINPLFRDRLFYPNGSSVVKLSRKYRVKTKKDGSEGVVVGHTVNPSSLKAVCLVETKPGIVVNVDASELLIIPDYDKDTD